MFEDLIQFIRNWYNTDGPIPLHEPRFGKLDRKYVMDAIASTFVSSVAPSPFKLRMALIHKSRRPPIIQKAYPQQQFPPTSSLSLSFNIYKKKEPPTENTAGIYLNFLAWPINFLGNGDRKQDLRPIPCDLPRRCSLLANANFPGIDPFCIFRSRILNSLAII